MSSSASDDKDPEVAGSPSGHKVLVFSVLADKLGCRELRVDTSERMRAGELLDQLAAYHDPIAEYRRAVRLAVNNEYVDEDHVVQPGDDLALITPTSGG